MEPKEAGFVFSVEMAGLSPSVSVPEPTGVVLFASGLGLAGEHGAVASDPLRIRHHPERAGCQKGPDNASCDPTSLSA